MHLTQKQFQATRFLLLVLAGVIVFNFSARAQFERYPLPPKVVKKSAPLRKGNSTARTKEETLILDLPFWDDFSFTPVDDSTNENANYPLDSLWKRGQKVRINNGIGIHPPSINVATFDGLDSLLRTYSAVLLENGQRDTLESQGIRLGEPNVTIAERNSVYLSFFFQWQGNGEPPDGSDHLRIEFKNDLNQWETVMTIVPKASFDRTEFYDTLIKVDGDRFFHNAFQFRFLNYGRKSGPYDTWNVDYVYLNKNRNAADTDFPDQAITSTMTSLFNKYQSIPYHHFLATDAMTSPTYDISNNLNQITDLTYLTAGTFQNWKDSIMTETFFSNLGGSDTSAINSDGSGIIFPLEKRTVTLEYVPNKDDNTQFNPISDSVFIKLKVKLFTGDTFDPKTGGYANDYDLNYLPIDFRINDTISTSYTLKDYYAYDDGLAEYAAGLTQAGNRAAVQFEMLRTDPDTLVGFDIYVPAYAYASNLTVDFYVYTDKDGLPGDILYSIPSVLIKSKGQNVFQRIPIVEPVLVDPKFYVGWKAPVGPSLKIGLDFSNNSGDKIYVNTNGTWSQSTDITGSLMIRPVFGGGGIVSGIEDEEENAISVFPNPNCGDFLVRGKFDHLQVLTVTGQSVAFEIQDLGTDHRVLLPGVASGLYILKVHQGNKISSSKFVIK